ncbi:MAG: T9SS type A sorting domain-containing protein [Bacteroidota bacterium]
MAPGTYTLSLTDANGCERVETAVVQALNCAALGLSVSETTPVSCNAVCDASITASASGGTGEINYQWSTGQTGAGISGLCAGTYTVTATDAQNCSSIQSITLLEPTALSLNATATSETGFGTDDGTATAAASGGTPGYQYSWSNGATGVSISGLLPGNYSVTATDTNGCTSEANVSVSAYVCTPFDPVVELKSTACAGSCDGAAGVVLNNPSGAYRFLWSDGQVTQTATGLCAGTYTVEITGADNCVSRKTIVVASPASLALAVNPVGESALGANDGSVTANVSGGTGSYTYQWSNGQTTSSLTGLTPGSYGLTVTDANGCSVTEAFIVEPFVCPAAGISTQLEPTLCEGECNGTATINVSGLADEFSVSWSNGETGVEATNLCAGVYNVSVTDAFNCSVSTEVIIEEPERLSPNVTTTNESAVGANDGTATASAAGGDGNYTFNWSNGATGSSVDGLAPGTYSVEITDGNGCSTTQSFSIASVQCNSLEATVNAQDLSCFESCDGVASVSLSGQTGEWEVAWSNGQNGRNISGLCVGSYTATITDAVGCSIVRSLDISQPTALQLSLNVEAESTLNANDGRVDATASGGTGPYTYTWSNGATGSMLTDLAPGSYTLSLTDQNACQTEETVFVQAYQCSAINLALSRSQNPLCADTCDGALSINVSGGDGELNILWSNGATTANLDNLCAGTYAVVVTDAAGCSISNSFDLVEPTPLSVAINASDESANGASDGSISLNVSGGTGDYTYSWSNGARTSDINQLSPGIYEIEVVDANGCTISQSVSISAFNCSSIAFNTSIIPVDCAGACNGTATIALENSEDFEITWSDGQTGASVSGLCVGRYSVNITSSDNCTATAEVEITAPEDLVVELEATPGDCKDQSGAVARVSGGVLPYVYSWSNGANTANVDGLEDGLYQISITDGNGCQAVQEIEVIRSSNPLSYSLESLPISCFGAADGSVSVGALNGSGPFRYEWNTGDTTQTISNVAPGSYSVIVTDTVGCSIGQAIELTQPDEINLAFTSTLKEDTRTGDLTVTASGGTPPYSYAWSNDATTVEIKDVPYGNYTVIVTDANGCTVERSIMLGTTSTGTIASLQRLALFPNPTQGVIQLDLLLSRSEVLTLQIHNVLGKVVWEEQLKTNGLKKVLQLEHLPKGSYFLHLVNKEGRVARRFILQ